LFEKLKTKIPDWLTPGAAEALAVKVYRLHKTKSITPEEALETCLNDYQVPVPRHVMEAQIILAAQEATDLSFVPEVFRKYADDEVPSPGS
jgi:hypothetical protein